MTAARPLVNVAIAVVQRADGRVLQALDPTPVYAITHAAKYGVAGFMPRLEQALAHRYGAQALVYGDETLARKVGGDGVHIPCSQLMQLATRPRMRLCAASCHSAEHLTRAAELGVDFAILSPVLPTASHPGQSGMGWARFAALARDCPLPVYALGGMKSELLDTARGHGAHGIALLSGIW